MVLDVLREIFLPHGFPTWDHQKTTFYHLPTGFEFSFFTTGQPFQPEGLDALEGDLRPQRDCPFAKAGQNMFEENSNRLHRFIWVSPKIMGKPPKSAICS